MPSNNPIVLDDLGQQTEIVTSKLTGQLTIRPDMVPLVNGDRTAGLKSLIDASVASGVTLIRLAAGMYDGIGRLDTADGSVLELAPGAVLMPRPLTSAEKTQENQDVANAGPDYYWPIVNLGNGARIHGGGSINGLKSVRPYASGVRILNRAGRSRVRLEIYNCGGDAVLFIGSHQVQVERADLHDCDGRGVHGVISNNARVHLNRIDTVQHGVQWWGDTTNGICAGWSITGNIVTNCITTTQNGNSNAGGGGIWGHLGQRIAVNGNTIDKCDDVGIDYETCNDSNASGNTVSNCKNAALAVFLGSQRITFTGNTVVQGTGMGCGFRAYGPSSLNTDITIQGGSITTTEATAHGVYTEAGFTESLTVDGVTIICNGGAVPVNSQDCHKTQVINCQKLQTTGGLGLDMRGGSNGRAEGNTLYYTGTDSANARAIRVYWRSAAYPAKNNHIKRNRTVGFGAGMYDDNNGDAASNTVFEDNITPSVTVNITAGWTGRRRGNRTDAGVFCDGSVSNTLPDGFSPKAAGRLTWTGSGFDSVVETLTGITGSTAGVFYIPVLTMPGSSAGSYDHSLFQVSLGKWAGNNKKVYTVKAGQRDTLSINYQCQGNNGADGTLMAYQDASGNTTFYLVVGPNYEYAVRYLMLNQSTPVSAFVSSTTAPTGTKVFDSSTTPPVAEFGDTLKTKGLDVQTKRAYTPTSTADATGATGDQTYDANSLYLRTPGGWVGTPLFSLGAFPIANTIVTTKTRAGIQAACDAAKDGDRIGMIGAYDFSGAGPTLTITKNIELVGLQGCIWDAGTTRHDMVLINSISTGITIKNIKMVSMHVGTTGDNGMILCNEVGDINNLLFENLEMTAPVGRYNAISMSAWSEAGNSGCFFRNLTFRNLYIHDMGRMGGELLAHKGDGVPRIIGVLVDKCTVKSVGLYNPANSDDVNGMGWSFSGEITNVMMIAPQVHDTLLGLEFVGTRVYQVIDPIITGSRSRTDSKGTLINAVGISITDGGQTDRGKSNLRPNQGVITGGRINVTGRPLNTRYADDVLFEVGNWNGGEYVQLQFGNGLKFRRQSIESSAAQFIIYFQQQTNLAITACKWSRETAAINGVHPLYEPVSFDGGCSGTINGLDIRTIGSPDNVGDGNNRNYLVSNSTPVKWQNLWWNGQRIADNQ